eukprot:SAG11_NODE_605_length_8236_cov_3.988571_7_plen_207_part_00
MDVAAARRSPLLPVFSTAPAVHADAGNGNDFNDDGGSCGNGDDFNPRAGTEVPSLLELVPLRAEASAAELRVGSTAALPEPLRRTGPAGRPALRLVPASPESRASALMHAMQDDEAEEALGGRGGTQHLRSEGWLAWACCCCGKSLRVGSGSGRPGYRSVGGSDGGGDLAVAARDGAEPELAVSTDENAQLLRTARSSDDDDHRAG